jgi:hypothetical protein
MSALIDTAEVAQVEPAVFASSGAAGAELLDAVTLISNLLITETTPCARRRIPAIGFTAYLRPVCEPHTSGQQLPERVDARAASLS